MASPYDRSQLVSQVTVILACGSESISNSAQHGKVIKRAHP
ncbi:predicted protein [Plenodomus lingam JN3]|uniref:Uncharacterized protein n=1 Tax=Leptosphaeria maculans (strain JN3 / isolate v23.1.3 / race Av1-4-5-6-7-8) TaxID=985895 RepID=E5A7C2_LEPMJ|nr:predicted protein [Plenodomus lingam JN3]CBX99517.1 predicted protein [Plenodomus lingam JN3]